MGREGNSLVRGIINQRERGEIMNDNLLGTLMGSSMEVEDIIDDCKLFYFAGSDTTSILLVWTIVMLSKYQEWQTRAREEVLKLFGNKDPTLDGLNHLKTVRFNMRFFKENKI